MLPHTRSVGIRARTPDARGYIFRYAVRGRQLPNDVISKNSNGLLCGACIIVKHSAETLPAADPSASRSGQMSAVDQEVSDPLMVSLQVIMSHELTCGSAEPRLSKPDHPFEARLLDGAHEALGIAVQVRGSRRQFHGFNAGIGQADRNSPVKSGSRSWIR